MSRVEIAILALWALLPQPGLAADDRLDGRELYLRKCGMCHLQGGTGTFMLGRRLGPDRALLEQRTDLPAVYVRQVVRAGLLNMPRFSRVELPEAELKAVANYLERPR